MADHTATNEYKSILGASLRALGQEAYVLQEHPDLIWQHLNHRLQLVSEETKNLLALAMVKVGQIATLGEE